MAIDKTVFSSDLTNVINEIPYDFTLDGQTVNCMTGPLDLDEELVIEGVYQNRDQQVMINTDDWNGDLPGVGDKPTVDGTEFRIERTSLSTCKKQLTMDMRRV